MSTEPSLASFVAAGDTRAAGEWLALQFARDVVGLCRAIVRDDAVAQDLAQDVFERALKHLDGFRGEASPRTWILRIARNRCIDHLRRVRVVESDEVEDPDDFPADPDLPEGPFGWGVDLWTALGALSEAERALVVLRVLHGFDYAELAHEMGAGEGALRMRYARAIAKLRVALEGEPLVSALRSECLYDLELTRGVSDSLQQSACMSFSSRPDNSLHAALARLCSDVPDRILIAIRNRLAGS